MRRLGIYLLIGFLNAAAVKAQAPPHADGNPASPVDLSQYTMIFHDELNTPVLDTHKWSYRQENQYRDGSTVLRSNVVPGRGTIRLEGNRSGDSSYSSSMISTDQSFHFKYGYVECRASLSDIGFGANFGLWLQSEKTGATMNPTVDGDEIDIFEYNLNSGGLDFLQHNLHWNGYGAQHRTWHAAEHIGGISKGYHTFGLLWTPDEYIFYVDGKETSRTNQAISHHSEFLILSNFVMANGFGGDRKAGKYPESIWIDYIRVYSPKASAHHRQ